MKLVDEARHWWRLFSVQAMILSGAVQGAWAAFGDDLKTYIPHAVATVLSMGLLGLGVAGRLVVQDSVQQAVNNTPASAPPIPQTPPPA